MEDMYVLVMWGLQRILDDKWDESGMQRASFFMRLENRNLSLKPQTLNPKPYAVNPEP